VFAPYERPVPSAKSGRLYLVILRYPDAGRAQGASTVLEKEFCRNPRPPRPSENPWNPVRFQTEDGWTGYRLNGAFLSLVFEAPDEAAARAALDAIRIPPLNKEYPMNKDDGVSPAGSGVGDPWRHARCRPSPGRPEGRRPETAGKSRVILTRDKDVLNDKLDVEPSR